MKSSTQITHSRISRQICLLALSILLLVAGGNQAAQAQWTTSSGNTTTTDKIGINMGTTVPGAPLDVNGTMAAPASATTATANGDLIVGALPTTGIALTIGNDASTSTPYSWLQSRYRTSNIFYNLALQPVGGNVGIGTLTPADYLHINNAGGAAAMRVSGYGGGFINFQDTAASANQKLFQWRSQGGVFRMALVNDDDQTYAQQNILVANANGNIGMGTATPTVNLDIAGTTSAPNAWIRVTRNNNTNADSSFITQPSGALTSSNVQWGFGLQGASNTFKLFSYDGSAVSNRFVVENNGKVGIGIDSPSAKLDVNGTVNATAFTINGSSFTGGPWATSGTAINYTTGNVGIGTNSPTTKLDVTGNVNVTGNIVASGSVTATYQDVAEWVPSSRLITAATVVVLDTQKSNQVIPSSEAYDTRVAGVVSARPGLILGVAGENKVMVATTGRVKVKVDATRAPIHVGDLLVTSDKEGVAMKSVPMMIQGRLFHSPGTLIGKALEPLAKGQGEILVLLSLQ